MNPVLTIQRFNNCSLLWIVEPALCHECNNYVVRGIIKIVEWIVQIYPYSWIESLNPTMNIGWNFEPYALNTLLDHWSVELECLSHGLNGWTLFMVWRIKWYFESFNTSVNHGILMILWIFSELFNPTVALRLNH